MKLKKLISLMLVFTMVATFICSVSMVAFAAGTAAVNFVVYDESGVNEVAGALENGKVYQVAVKLSDISEKSFASAQLAVYYNPAVLQAVKANGDAATAIGQIAIDNNPMYSYDEENDVHSGIYTRMANGSSLDVTNGLIKYTLVVNTDAREDNDASKKYNGKVANDGEFEIVRLRFKAIADGKTDLQVATKDLGEGKYNPALESGIGFIAVEEPVDVSTTPAAIRVGEVAYVSAVADEAFAASKTYVVGNTDADAIIADLAKDYATVNVTYTDEEGGNTPADATITWVADKSFDAEKAGEYKFVGNVTAPEGINYTGAAVTVEATITLDTLKVQEVDAIADIVARVDDTVTLPSEVGVTVTGDEKATLAISAWDPAEVVTATAGETTYTGTIEGTENIDANGKTASVKVIVLAKSEESAPTDIDKVEVEATIDAENIAEDALEALPEFVTLGTDTKTYINVTKWVQVTVEPEGGFGIGDVIEFKPETEGVDFGDYVAKVTVSVPAGKATVNFETTEFATAEVTTNDLYTLDKAIAEAAFAGKYADGTEVDLSTIVWDKDGAEFDAQTAGTYTLVGTWSDIYGNEQTFTITIKVVNAGATGLAIYKSPAPSAAPITKLNLEIGDSVKLYHRFEPADAIDTVSWSSSKKIVEFKVNVNDSNYITLKAKSAGTCDIYAVTSQGVKVTIKVTVNGTYNNDTYYGGYKKNPAVGQLLANAADEMEQDKVAEASAFNDLAGYKWAATQVETLRLLGIVSGKTNTTYAPADSVTRAEFLAMLVRLFGFQAKGEAKTFTDVPADAWYYNTVAVASSLGIAYGYENGAFDPNAVISRQDMAVFAERALNAAGVTAVRGIERGFNDQANISDYAKTAVSNMAAIGAINGMNDGTFAPQDTANRAQAAVVVYNLYVLKNK